MGEEALTILILDDEGAVLESFCDYFEDHGFRTLPVKSAEAALELLKFESPDAAVVDMRMGGMSGDDFISEACIRRSGCAFVICTGFPDYRIPDGIRVLQRVSPTVFHKPVADLDRLRREILRMVALVREGAPGDE